MLAAVSALAFWRWTLVQATKRKFIDQPPSEQTNRQGSGDAHPRHVPAPDLNAPLNHKCTLLSPSPWPRHTVPAAADKRTAAASCMQPYRPQQPARVQCDSDDTCGTMERGRHACDATVRQSAARRPHKLGAARTRTATRARTQPRAERALHAPGERLYCRALAKLLNHALCDLPAARAWCQ